MSATATPMVDVNVPRFNQALVALLTAAAFVLDLRVLVVVTFVILAVSWLGGPTLAPFTRIYVGLVRPRIQGPTEFEPAAPPRFSQLLGALFLGAASVALYAGAIALGWTLTLVVTALASLAAAARICVGCIVYERTLGR
ncbi:MAG: DUF4395 domain-containing protein [Acidimicrobiia bacterium]